MANDRDYPIDCLRHAQVRHPMPFRRTRYLGRGHRNNKHAQAVNLLSFANCFLLSANIQLIRVAQCNTDQLNICTRQKAICKCKSITAPPARANCFDSNAQPRASHTENIITTTIAHAIAMTRAMYMANACSTIAIAK